MLVELSPHPVHLLGPEVPAHLARHLRVEPEAEPPACLEGEVDALVALARDPLRERRAQAGAVVVVAGQLPEAVEPGREGLRAPAHAPVDSSCVWSPVTTTWSKRSPEATAWAMVSCSSSRVGMPNSSSSGSAKRWRSVSCRMRVVMLRESVAAYNGSATGIALDTTCRPLVGCPVRVQTIPDTAVPLEVAPSAFAGLLGVARRDTTPPDGIYARMWGAATHDLATGVHRPLSTTVLALQAAGGRPRLLVALDIALLGDLGGASDAERVLTPVREELGLEPGELLVNCSHTHAAPWAALSRSHNPGGELIAPYLDQLSRAILEAGQEAIASLAPATLTWATGRWISRATGTCRIRGAQKARSSAASTPSRRPTTRSSWGGSPRPTTGGCSARS